MSPPAAAIATTLLATAAALAQPPSAWATLTPPGGVTAAQATSVGKVVAYVDGGVLHAWSAVTRLWTSHAVGQQGVLRLNNDCLLAQDGGSWLAWSAFTGGFAAAPASPNAQLHNALGAQNDGLLAFTDLGQLHVFCAFDGQWRSRPVQPSAVVAVQRNVLLLQQGALLSAMDAASGQWHDHAVATAPTSSTVDGSLAVAWIGTSAHAFSAPRRTWIDATVPAGATFVRADDWAAFCGPDRALAFSASAGCATGCAAGGMLPVAASDLLGLFDDGVSVRGFSALTGAWSGPLAASGAQAWARGATGLLVDGAGACGYSAVRDAAATLPGPIAGSGAADTVAWARPLNAPQPSLFSAHTGTWLQAPAAWTTDPLLATTAAVTATAGGCVVFSPRTGRFIALASPGAQVLVNPSSAPIVAVTPSAANAFDARQDRWIACARGGGGTVTAQVWRTAALLIDGAEALVYGAQAGVWSRLPLATPALGVRANSESVRIVTATGIHAGSALPGAGWHAQFPEFRRVQSQATTASWYVGAPPGGGAVVAAIGLPVAQPWLIPGLGGCWIDPVGAFLAPAVALAPGAGAGGQLPAPAVWPCVGVEVGLQAACLPASGSPYMTELATLRPL